MSYDSEILADSPRSYYKLDDTAGTTAVDSSGNGRDATYGDVCTLAQSPAFSLGNLHSVLLGDGNVGTFDTEGHIALPATGFNPGTGDWSIEMWVKFQMTLATFWQQGLFYLETASQFLVFSVLPASTGAGYPHIHLGTTFTDAFQTATYPNDLGWHHIVATYQASGPTMRLYLDGVLDSSTSVSSGNDFTTVTAAGIGSDTNPLDDALSGWADNVAFYHSRLSDARVLAHYNASTSHTNYPEALTDTVGITDELKVLLKQAHAAKSILTETVGISDSGAEHQPHFARSLTDTVGITDSVHAALVLHLPLLTVTATALGLTVDAPTTPVATAAGQQTLYEILSVDYDGNVYASYPTGRVTQVVETLNGVEDATFTIPVDAVDLDQLPLAKAGVTPPREVQIWRNGHLLFWGVPHTRRANRSQRLYTYTAKGLLWYFTRRYFGKADRHNFLTNPEFESNFTGWTLVGSGITETTPTNLPLIGSKSLKLVGDSTPNANRYAQQTVTVGPTGHLGLALFLTAWFYIDTFTGPAALDLGVLIQRVGATGAGSQGVVTIDSTTPRKQWQRVTAHVNMPPFTTENISVSLYGIEGTIYWDGISVTAQQSFTLGPTPFDEAAIAAGIVGFMQDRGSAAHEFGDDLGKSDLNIGTICPATGVLKQRTYFFSDHQQAFTGTAAGGGALDEFVNSQDGFDLAVTLTPHTRTFRTYYPRIGTERTDAVLAWRFYGNGDPRNYSWGIVDWDLGETIDKTANQVTELGGWGQGSGREEGGYTNDSSLGGLTLELVESLPQGVPIDQMDQTATQRGKQLENTIFTPTVTVTEPRDPVTQAVTYPMIGVIKPGDSMAIDLIDGDVVLNTTYRFVQVTLNIAADDSETLALVPNVVQS